MSGRVHVSFPIRHIALLEIDNPPRNVMGKAMRAELRAALDSFEADLDIRCIVLTGRGKAFCSGDNINEELAGAEGPDRGDNVREFGGLITRIENFRCPVIAAINGWSVGGGFELALGCDIRIASDEAKFIAAGVKVGLMASAYRLPRLIGIAAAKSVLLTGRVVNAEAALAMNLVAAVHPHDQLMEAALEMAAMIASRAPLSVEATKRVASGALDVDPVEAAKIKSDEVAKLIESEDHKEALRAFIEKRDPVFKRA